MAWKCYLGRLASIWDDRITEFFSCITSFMLECCGMLVWNVQGKHTLGLTTVCFCFAAVAVSCASLVVVVVVVVLSRVLSREVSKLFGFHLRHRILFLLLLLWISFFSAFEDRKQTVQFVIPKIPTVEEVITPRQREKATFALTLEQDIVKSIFLASTLRNTFFKQKRREEKGKEQNRKRNIKRTEQKRKRKEQATAGGSCDHVFCCKWGDAKQQERSNTNSRRSDDIGPLQLVRGSPCSSPSSKYF